jgi:hypothetical protein
MADIHSQGALLWLLGIPLPFVILLWLFGFLHCWGNYRAWMGSRVMPKYIINPGARIARASRSEWIAASR